MAKSTPADVGAEKRERSSVSCQFAGARKTMKYPATRIHGKPAAIAATK